MIEEIVLQHLKRALQLPILMELPEVPSEDFPAWPERFVVIERVGGSETDHIKSASIALQSYSICRLADAAALDDDVKRAMPGLTEYPGVGGVRLSSNYNHTDTRTKRYRYQCVWEIYHTD